MVRMRMTGPTYLVPGTFVLSPNDVVGPRLSEALRSYQVGLYKSTMAIHHEMQSSGASYVV